MNFSFLPQFWSYFNYGVLVTIMISVCVVFFGTILGVFGILGQTFWNQTFGVVGKAFMFGFSVGLLWLCRL